MKKVFLAVCLLWMARSVKADLIGATYPPVSAPTAQIDLSTVTAPANPANGTIWDDATQNALIGQIDASTQTLTSILFSMTASSASANTIGEAILLSTANAIGLYTLPTNFFTVGKTIHFVFRGFESTTGAPLPTLNLKVKFGTTVLLSSGPIQQPSVTNGYWTIEGDITCRTTGSSGTVFAQGEIRQASATVGTPVYIPIVNTGTTTIDTTATQTLGLNAVWNTASASNSVTVTNGYVQVIN